MIAKFIKVQGEVLLNKEIDIGTGEGMPKVPINKERPSITYKVSIIAKNQEMCQIEDIQETDYKKTVYDFGDEKVIVKFPIADSIIGNWVNLAKIVKEGLENKDEFKPLDIIYDENDNLIGGFDRKIVTGETLLDNYQYNIITFKGKSYDVYMIADNNRNGIDGINLNIYDQDGNIIGIIKKDRKVKNGMATYNMYFEDESYLKLMTIICNTWHKQEYDEEGLGITIHNERTPAKKVRDMYNPQFIEKIVNSTPTEYQIENMPLVKEKMEEAQKSKSVKWQKITLLITILLIVAVIIIASINADGFLNWLNK